MDIHMNPEQLYSRELEGTNAARLCFDLKDQLQKLF